jgi:AcrR family transcriptional regulator
MSSGATALTARQQRAKETRARLFAAAAELFDAQGYHETTVEQIVRRANVAKGTFFLHFATKDAVIAELVRIQVRGARKARERVVADGGSALERLRATVMGLGEMAELSRALSRAVLAAAIANPALGGHADVLFHEVFDTMVPDAREAQAAGLLDREPEAETMAQVLMASYLGAALHFVSSPRARPLVDILTPLVDANIAAFRRTVADSTGVKKKSSTAR